MQVEQFITLVIGVLGSGALVRLITYCVERAKVRTEVEAADLNNDALEQKIRIALYGENMGLRKDLDESYARMKNLNQRMVELETALAEAGKHHAAEIAEMNARLHTTERRLDECEKHRALLQEQFKDHH